MLFDPEKIRVERVASASSLFAPFDPQVLKGEELERLPYLSGMLEHLRVAEFRDTASPRRDLAVDAARFLAMNVRSALVCAFSLRSRERFRWRSARRSRRTAGTRTCTCC